MERKRNKFLIILSSLFSPFSILIFASAVVNLIGEIFKKNGFLVPILLFIAWLIISGFMAFFDLTNEDFKTSDTYRHLLNHAKVVGITSLILIPVIVISSLLYQLDIPDIVLACSTSFLVGLPIGIIPLLVFVRKDIASPLVARKIEYMLSIFFPVLLGEALMVAFLTVFKFGFAFNPFELLILHFVLYFLLYLASFIISIKNKRELEVRKVLKFDKLFLSLTGVTFFFALIGGFFIVMNDSLKECSLSFNFDNISTVLFLEESHYLNVQQMLFVIVGYVVIFLSYGSSMLRPMNRKIDISGTITLLIGALTVFFLTMIPYHVNLFMNGNLSFTKLSIGVILAFAPIFIYLLFEIINLRLALKEIEKR